MTDKLEKLMPKLYILTYALGSSYVVIGAVPYLGALETAGAADSLDQGLKLPLLLLSGVILVVSASLRSLLLKVMTKTRKDSASAYLGIFLNAHIITLAIRESGVILAFVWSVISGEKDWAAIAAGIAVAITVLQIPTRKMVEEIIPPELRKEGL
ncbi:MAG: hypothetical protein KDD70_12335 [Bdellovibrionales bacterium]|nr:hypothetical protein [Bdellovibrionales bacterium]